MALQVKKKRRPVTLKSMSELSSYLLPLNNFALEVLFSTRGLRGRTIFELIGGEGIGKTTLLFTMLGHLMPLNNSPVLYVNTEGENKLPNTQRILRCLHTNPNMARKMLDIIEIVDAYEIREAVELIEDFVTTTRQYLDDKGATEIPILICIDTLSKLMSPGEAAGLIDGPEDAKTTKDKGLGGASNLEFSKLMHYWARRLINFLQKNNVLLFTVNHQNIKIDMSGFGSPMSSEVSAGYNKNRRGGGAFNQNAALQCTIKRIGFAKNSKGEPVGHNVQLRVVKSSIGPDNSTLDYILKVKDFTDAEEYQEPALIFDEGLARFFAENKLLGTTVSRKRYTSKELGAAGATAQEFVEALNERDDLRNKVGVQLGIEGYINPEWSEENKEITGEDDPGDES